MHRYKNQEYMNIDYLRTKDINEVNSNYYITPSSIMSGSLGSNAVIILQINDAAVIRNCSD